MSYAYLASPYTHPDPKVMHERFAAAEWALYNYLLRENKTVYSPIVHYHQMALSWDMPKDFDFWMRHNYPMLAKASELLVLNIDGWRESRGVKAEMEMAAVLGIPQQFVYPEGVNNG